MPPEKYDLPYWAKLSNLKLPAAKLFDQMLKADLIDWMKTPEVSSPVKACGCSQSCWHDIKPEPEPDYTEHTCGCGYPNASPPCWHCTDCEECFCKYCGEPHEDGDDCPVLMNPLAYI